MSILCYGTRILNSIIYYYYFSDNMWYNSQVRFITSHIEPICLDKHNNFAYHSFHLSSPWRLLFYSYHLHLGL